MPNWCQNTLQVIGDEQDVKAFMVAAKTETTSLSLDALVPSPEDGWYDWRLQNWGTKWDVEAEHDYTSGEVIYTFNTAWSPPEEWLGTVATMYPALRFALNYEESGVGFAGYVVYVDGFEVDSAQYSVRRGANAYDY